MGADVALRLRCGPVSAACFASAHKILHGSAWRVSDARDPGNPRASPDRCRRCPRRCFCTSRRRMRRRPPGTPPQPSRCTRTCWRPSRPPPRRRLTQLGRPIWCAATWKASPELTAGSCNSLKRQRAAPCEHPFRTHWLPTVQSATSSLLHGLPTPPPPCQTWSDRRVGQVVVSAADRAAFATVVTGNRRSSLR